MLSRAFDILEPLFIKHVLPESGHKLLASSEYWEPLLATLPNSARMVRDRMIEEWSSTKKGIQFLSPAEKWDQLKQHLKAVYGRDSTVKRMKNMDSTEKERIESWPIEVVFRYTYPRLDINVSKMQNHLLKSPFCIHPKTGRVCVPIQAETVESFDPFSVPTLPQLMKEIDDYEEKDPMEDGRTMNIRKDWQKTSLKQYFEPFQKKFLEPLQKELRYKAREESERKAAIIGDF